jgi:hypothetical protein
LHPRLDEGYLEQPVKVGGHDHPHVAETDEFGDRPVRPGRRLDALLAFLSRRLEEPLKEVPPLRRCRGELT